MPTYGVAEAKNKFTHLLDRVEDGERIVITRHGKPVAEIVQLGAVPRHASSDKVLAALERLKTMREGLPPAHMPAADLIRSMRDEGA